MNKFLLAAAICWTATLSSVADAQTTGQYTVSTALNTPGNLVGQAVEISPNIFAWGPSHTGSIYREDYGGTISVSKFDTLNNTRRLTSVKVQIFGLALDGDWSLSDIDYLVYEFYAGLRLFRDIEPKISSVSVGSSYINIFEPTPQSSGSLDATGNDFITTYAHTDALDAFTGPGAYVVNWTGELISCGEFTNHAVTYSSQVIYQAIMSVTYYWESVP